MKRSNTADFIIAITVAILAMVISGFACLNMVKQAAAVSPEAEITTIVLCTLLFPTLALAIVNILAGAVIWLEDKGIL